MAANEYILVAFPNGSEGVGATMKNLERAIACPESNYSGTFAVVITTTTTAKKKNKKLTNE